jgi:hypothetical protein
MALISLFMRKETTKVADSRVRAGRRRSGYNGLLSLPAQGTVNHAGLTMWSLGCVMFVPLGIYQTAASYGAHIFR